MKHDSLIDLSRRKITMYQAFLSDSCISLYQHQERAHDLSPGNQLSLF